MAAVSNQVVKRRGRDGKRVAPPVAAGIHIYEGTDVFLDANGYATDVKVDANTVYVGIAIAEVDNSSGANGDVTVECWTDGDFERPIAGTLAQAELGTSVYAPDNYGWTQTSTANVTVGTLIEIISSAVGVVRIKGLGEA